MQSNHISLLRCISLHHLYPFILYLRCFSPNHSGCFTISGMLVRPKPWLMPPMQLSSSWDHWKHCLLPGIFVLFPNQRASLVFMYTILDRWRPDFTLWTLSPKFVLLQTYIKPAFVDILVSVSLSDLHHSVTTLSLIFHFSDISFNLERNDLHCCFTIVTYLIKSLF